MSTLLLLVAVIVASTVLYHKLNSLHHEVITMSSVLAEVKVYAAKIDAQTNTIGSTATRIAGDLKALQDQLVDATTAEEVAQILGPSVDALTQVGADLEAIGKNPASI